MDEGGFGGPGNPIRAGQQDSEGQARSAGRQEDRGSGNPVGVSTKQASLHTCETVQGRKGEGFRGPGNPARAGKQDSGGQAGSAGRQEDWGSGY